MNKIEFNKSLILDITLVALHHMRMEKLSAAKDFAKAREF